MKINTVSNKFIVILITILLVDVSIAFIYFFTMDIFIIVFTIILAALTLVCFFVQIISRDHKAKLINLITLYPFNRTISKYFVSANTFIIYSIIVLILTLVVSHEVWEARDLDKKISIGIFGGGLLIVSYFFNAGIKLHTIMRDKSLEYIQEHRKNKELKIPFE